MTVSLKHQASVLECSTTTLEMPFLKAVALQASPKLVNTSVAPLSKSSAVVSRPLVLQVSPFPPLKGKLGSKSFNFLETCFKLTLKVLKHAGFLMIKIIYMEYPCKRSKKYKISILLKKIEYKGKGQILWRGEKSDKRKQRQITELGQ